MSAVQKVLVIGDDTRSFLSTVRSLGRQGLEVHAAPFDFTSPALASRYIHTSHFLPYYLDGGAAWRDAITALLRTHQFALVIPCDERGLLPLCLHREMLGELSTLAIPSSEELDTFFDKVKTRALAESVAVPVAPGRMLAPDDTIDRIIADLGLPVVVKQPMSYALPELYARTSTRILADRPALSNWLAGHDHASGPILLERMFAGFGLGVSVLCDRGAILQAFEHHRAHEVDGSSYYRKSAPLEAGRLDAVARMVKASAYTGLAMFEFKVDPKSGNWILIEVNARPWGSLPLPVSIGVDFPYRLYRLLALGDPTPPVPYPSQRYCRNLLLDMYQVKAGAGPLVRQPGKLIAHCLAWVWGFHRVLLGREHHDALVLDDPQPGLLELRRLFGARLSPAAGKPRPGAGLAARLAALDPAQGPVDVLFVCQGNINRSSYAELKSTQLMGNEKLRFASAGMLPRNRRGSPAVAIGAAALHGVDMSAHRSRHASAELLEAATVIIVFDQINLRSIRQRYPALRNQVFLLGELIASDGAREIADPEGKTEATFLATYAQIDACLAELSRAIAVPPTH